MDQRRPSVFLLRIEYAGAAKPPISIYRAALAGLGIILMHTGLGTLTVWPVGRSVPVCGIDAEDDDRVGVLVLRQQILRRSGRWRSCGGSCPGSAQTRRSVSLPVLGSIAKIAMLSCPRLDP